MTTAAVAPISAKPLATPSGSPPALVHGDDIALFLNTHDLAIAPTGRMYGGTWETLRKAILGATEAHFVANDPLVVGPAVTIDGVAYTWPATQSAATFLKNDGAGNLTWAAASATAALATLTDVTLGSLATGQWLAYNAGTSKWNNSTATLPTTATTGDTLYASGANAWARLGAGTAFQFKQMNAGGSAPQWHTLVAADITNAAALTQGSDTNVVLTLGGTPASALLAAASITVSWSGTLAAGRLNANVVQSIVNDTNVQGSITAQALTLAWAGTLGVARGGTNLASYTTGDTLYASGPTTLAKLGIGAANTIQLSNGTAPTWAANLPYATLPTGNGSWDTGAGSTITVTRSLTVSGTLTAAAFTVSGLITASAGLTVASGQTLTLTGATVAGAPTWSSAQTFGALLTASAGIAVTGNSTITGTLGGITTLTATTLGGTLATAAQPNVTTMAGLTTAGALVTVGTIATGVWNATTITTQFGGTGRSSFTTGDLPYYASGSALSTLGIAAANAVLTSSGSAPQWSTSLTLAGAIAVGTTLGVTGAVTLSSTLAVAGNVNINSGEFTIAAVTGNTVTQGTLQVVAGVTLGQTASGAAFTIAGTVMAGTNQAAAALKQTANLGTGSGTVGTFVWQTGHVLGSSATGHTLENNLVLGDRVATFGAAGAAYTMQGAAIAGTNQAQGTLTVIGPLGTGNATPAQIIFQTAHIQSSGASPHVATTILTLGDAIAIVGADPGGSQLLRIGGSVHASGAVTFDSTLVVTGAVTGTLATAVQPNVTTMANLTTIGTLVAGSLPATLVNGGMPAQSRTVTNLSTYLANNAVFNVLDYGADPTGVGDSTAAFVAACNAASVAGGGVVLVPAGTFTITNTINVPVGTTLFGSSQSSALVFNTGSTLALQATGSDVTFDGLNISGNLAVAIRIGYARCTVRNCRITGCVQAETISGVCAAILMSGANDALIEHNYCYGNGYVNGGQSSIYDICQNVQGVPSTRGVVRGNHCLSTLIVASIALYDVDSTTAVDNIASGANCFSAQAGGYGILFYRTLSVGLTACHNNSAVNNLVYNCQGTGIYMQGQYRCVVMGNRIHDIASVQADTSLQVGGIAMAGTPFSVCSGNRIENSGLAGISIGDTASTTYDEGLTVTGNTILNATGRPGIFIRASLLRCSITGNVVENSNGGIADLVTGQTTIDCVISSNIITGGTGTVAAIQVSLATRVSIVSNTIYGAPTYGIYCIGGNFCNISDNVAWDCSQTTSGGAYGIQVSCPDSTINGNVVGNTSSTGVSYCILVNAANCVVIGNRCKNGVTGDLNISGSGTYAAGNSDRNSAGTFNVPSAITASGGLTVASGQTLTLTGATVAGTPTWSSNQAITLSTAAQPNVTSLGALTGLIVGSDPGGGQLVRIGGTLVTSGALAVSASGSAFSSGTDSDTFVVIGTGGTSPTANRNVILQLNGPSGGSFLGQQLVQFRQGGVTGWGIGQSFNLASLHGAATDFVFDQGAGTPMAVITAAGVVRSIGGFTTTGGAASSFGTTDAFALNFITNSGTRASFDSSGNFSINTTKLTVAFATGNLVSAGSLTTGAPAGGSAGTWKLGILVTAAITADLTKYIQLDIGGVLYKLVTAS